MTLRSQIHAAIDDVAPPAANLRYEVLAATADAVAPKRRNDGNRRLPLVRVRVIGLTAATLIAVLVVGGVMVGGRILRDYQRQQAIAAFQRAVSQLEERPLTLPDVSTTQTCPETSATAGFDMGDGPVYADAGVPSAHTPYVTATLHSGWGYYFDSTWLTKPGLSGPVLVRGLDLNHANPIVFVGPYATGSVVGTDYIQGKQTLYSELVLNADAPPTRSSNTQQVKFGEVGPTGYGEWVVRFGIARPFTGCFGFQVDGPSFTETIVAHWAPSINGL